jgi:membrane protease YdiL (CAAX protease family)
MTALGARRTRSIVTPAALVVGLAAAVEMRLVVGGVTVRDSVSAGIAFAAALMALAVAATRITAPISTASDNPASPRRVILAGAGGAAVLCVPVVTRIASVGQHRPAGNYVTWSLVVAVVAISEEVLLRGVLYSQVEQAAGAVAAVITTSVCFAALHVPIYGWHAGGLDLAVGLWLGALRYVTRSWHASAVAHVAADLAGWWLR